MQEITLAVIVILSSEQRVRSMSYSSSRLPLLLGSFIKSDAVHNLALTKVALQGLVLDCSLGAGVTDQTFLIPFA